MSDAGAGTSALSLLTTENLSVRFGGTYAVREASLRIGRGERVGLIGPNGAGKSSLVNALTGEVRSCGGSIRFENEPIDGLPTFQRARRGLLRTRQELELFASMTVEENVRCGADNPGTGRSHRRAPEWVGQVLSAVGLEAERHTVVGLLPYGARKLVELARALAGRPTLLLLDEPVAGLNTVEKRAMVDRLDAIAGELLSGLLLIEHDMSTVAALCPERIYAMVAGEVVAEGPFDDVVRAPEVVTAYLGGHPVAIDGQGGAAHE